MKKRPTTEEAYSLQVSMGYWVTRLARAMETDFEERLGEYGVTRASWAVLSAIVHHDKSTPAELAAFIEVDGAAITRHLDRLVKHGLIARRRVTKDRRSIKLTLTAKGADVVPKLAAASKATNDKFLIGLTQAEARSLQTIIEKMLSNAGVVPSDL